MVQTAMILRMENADSRTLTNKSSKKKRLKEVGTSQIYKEITDWTDNRIRRLKITKILKERTETWKKQNRGFKPKIKGKDSSYRSSFTQT